MSTAHIEAAKHQENNMCFPFGQNPTSAHEYQGRTQNEKDSMPSARLRDANNFSHNDFGNRFCFR